MNGLWISLSAGVLALIGLVSAALAAPMPTQDTPRKATDLVSVRLSSDTVRVGPGETFHLVLEFTIKPEWHIYWKNPGETGAPTQFDITGPNYDIGQPIFSRPQRIDGPDGLTYGYEKRAVVAVPVTAPKDLNDGSARFLIDINYLVCKSFCLMGRGNMQIDIDTSSAPTGHNSTLEDLGKELEVSFPKPIKDLEGASASFDGKELTIIAPTLEGDAKSLFFPMEMPGVTYEQARFVNRDRFVHIIVPVDVKPENALGKAMRVAGLIALGKKQTDPCYEFDLPVSEMDASQADSSKD